MPTAWSQVGTDQSWSCALTKWFGGWCPWGGSVCPGGRGWTAALLLLVAPVPASQSMLTLSSVLQGGVYVCTHHTYHTHHTTPSPPHHTFPHTSPPTYTHTPHITHAPPPRHHTHNLQCSHCFLLQKALLPPFAPLLGAPRTYHPARRKGWVVPRP